MSKEQKPSPSEIEAAEEIGQRLLELLAARPELAAKLLEAIETERFFITASFQKKETPEDPNDLRHLWYREKYNQFNVVTSLKHIAADWCAKENPMAQIEGGDWV